MPFPNCLHALYKIGTTGRLALLTSQEDHDGDLVNIDRHLPHTCMCHAGMGYLQNLNRMAASIFIPGQKCFFLGKLNLL